MCKTNAQYILTIICCTNIIKIYKVHGKYYIENTLMSFLVRLILNSCCFDSKLFFSVISIERFVVSTGMFLKYLVFRNVVFCRLVPDISKCRCSLLCRVKETRTNFLRRGSSMLILLTIFLETLGRWIRSSNVCHIYKKLHKENNSRTGPNPCLESNFNIWSHFVRVPITYLCFGVCTMFSSKRNTHNTQLFNKHVSK
jgi:hypothetical protein